MWRDGHSNLEKHCLQPCWAEKHFRTPNRGKSWFTGFKCFLRLHWALKQDRWRSERHRGLIFVRESGNLRRHMRPVLHASSTYRTFMLWASRTVRTGGFMCDGGSWPLNSVTSELLVQPASVQALSRSTCGVYTPRPERGHRHTKYITRK